MYLQKLTQLKRLDLRGTQISDAGLVHLRSLGQLELLNLNWTQVSESGSQDLKRFLPTLQLVPAK